VHFKQISDAHKTITKQDELILSLRNELRKFQDIIIQKDSVIKMNSLETVKYRETIEMLQFDLDRLRNEHHSKGNETPRVQNENKVIRDQIRGLLEEAKDRSHDITRLKKISYMYELQKEEMEHKVG
jgi:hypothetical protein